MFLAKYSSAAMFQWAFSAGSSGSEAGLGIAADNASVVVTGVYGGTVDFKPGSGVANLTAATSQDAFIARYSSSGTYSWAIGLRDGWATSVVIDGGGDIRVAGSFRGTDDFDPSGGTANLTSIPATDINCFVARYSSSGGYHSAFGLPGTGGSVLALDGAGGMVVTGNFGAAATDFDPGDGVASLTSAGSGDIFVARYTDITLPKFAVNQIAGIHREMALRIAPNPFTSEFTLRYDGASAPSHLQIFDMMGRVVESREVADPNEEITLGSALPAGAYFVEIVQGEERRQMLVHKVK
jgi:hypothetical protein